MLRLKRIETFCASHRLYHPNWSDEKNQAVFGKCSHIHGHGHNYKLEVEVCGSAHPENGMIFSVAILKELIKTHVIDHVDHKHLNFDVPWLSGKIPTTEVLVEAVWGELEKVLFDNGAVLHSVTIWETEKNAVTKVHNCLY